MSAAGAQRFDVVVVGAGPAGISAALTAQSLGLCTLLLDEQPRPGGQIYRNVTQAEARIGALLGPDYLHGATLTDRLAASGVTAWYGALVWDVAHDGVVTGLRDGKSFQVQTSQLIAATGALERASPIAGWTLPGVLNAGAAQIALKASGAIPAGRVVLAGGGPLLLLVACQLLDAGAQIDAIVETSPADNRGRAMRHLPAAMAAPQYLLKGLRMMARLRTARVPWFTQATALRVEGEDRVQGLAFESGGKPHGVKADVVLLHHGVIPNTQLTRLLRVEHAWDSEQLCWRAAVDDWGQTSMAMLRVAGDGAGIAGALAAEHRGVLAALGAAHALGRLSNAERDRRARPVRRAMGRQLLIRPFLDTLYRPPTWINAPDADVMVCRCEEVSAERIREMARLGCQGPNQTKFFSRCGMGPCQGRVCGNVVTQILASELGKPPAEVGAYHIRAPLKPVPMESIVALTGLDHPSEAAGADTDE